MSLGFLTESALVPSKAKEIKIDGKSLVDLKAVVYQKDQERKRRLHEALTAENDGKTSTGHNAHCFSKYAHLRGGNKREKRSREDRTGRSCRNKGVESRRRRDEEAEAREVPSEDDDEAWMKRSAEMLQKKAKLYEEMERGGGSEDVKGECLVNFKVKRKGMCVKEESTVEIMDEFGRTRKVAADCSEYVAGLDTLQQDQLPKRTERHCEETLDKNTEGGGSFVVSQWEKRLKSAEKDHLKEVHERATLAQSIAHASSSDVAEKKTRKQLRLERLRKHREDKVSSSNAPSSSAAADFAASEKATDFLNRLTSLV